VRTGLVICLLAAAAIGAAPARAATTFGGYTSTAPNQPIVVTADAGRTKVLSVVFSWSTGCSDDARHGVFDAAELTAAPGAPGAGATLGTSRNGGGRFAGVSERTVTLADGLTANVRLTISGTLGRRSATGTYSAEVVTIGDAPAAGVCDKVDQRWKASSDAGWIYGGSTSQGQPLVLRLNDRRTSVADLIVGWGVPRCRPESFGFNWQLGDWLSDFAIAHGRFGDNFSQRYHLKSGSDALFDYDVAGTILRGPGTARGTFSARESLLLFSAPAMLVCDSGDLTWHARTG
jgi:hypothetical protein